MSMAGAVSVNSKSRSTMQARSVGCLIRANPPEDDYDWHTAPQRQFIVLLDGEIEIEVSSGEPRKRIFHGGDVLLMEDTAGRGHRTRNIQPRERRSVFIVLADQAQNT